MPTVLHVSPHPDDESIAAPCTLLALRDAGWTVVNVAVSLGRPEVRERRRAELEAALAVAGFRSVVLDLAISRGDDLGSAARRTAHHIARLREEHEFDLVVGPHPREGHHGHATVAEAIRGAVWRARRPLSWWMWSIWSDLPLPTLVVDCPDERLRTSETMIEQHAGEIARTRYQDVQRPTRIVNAVRGVEKTFGYGCTVPARAEDVRYAELLTEVTVHRRPWSRKRWMVARPRVLDPLRPFDDVEWDRLRDRSILSSAHGFPTVRGPRRTRS